MKIDFLKIAILLILFIMCPYQIVFLIIVVIYISFLNNRTKLLVIIIFIYVFFQMNYYPYTKNLNGKVSKISDNYIIVNNSILYGDTSKLDLFDHVTIDCDVEVIKDEKSFYAFKFKNYYLAKRVKYRGYLQDYHLVRKSYHPLALLYRKIKRINNPILKNFYFQIILNIKNEEVSNFIFYNGFLFSGIFFWQYFLLKWFIDAKRINRVRLFTIFVFLLVYNFPFILVRLFTKQLLKILPINKYDSLGILIIVLLITNPYNLFSLAFIYPVSFYFVQVFHHKTVFAFYFNSVIIQATFLYSVQIIKVIFFKYIIRLMGLIYIISLLFLFINPDFSLIFINFMHKYSQLNLEFQINGNVNFINGLLTFILFLKLRDRKYQLVFITIFFLLLNYTNISHPFTKVSYINVLQGDATLIKLHYNQGNILIDTGKESSYIYLDSYLKANGISKINYLIITHDDNDHNGNIDNLVKDYEIDNIITQPIDIRLSSLTLTNLNYQKSDNDNDNSLIYVTKINGLTYFFGGDISKKIENGLLELYPKLNIDILKLSHHGSKTSSDSFFIKEVNPLLALISAGNTYNHPSLEVINNLKRFKVKYLITKEDGDIEIYANLFANILYTSSRNFVIIH